MRLAVSLTLMVGCAAHRTPAWEKPPLSFGDVSAEILDDMVKKGDAAFAGREDPQKLDDAIDEYRGALRYRPDDSSLLVRLSRAARLRAHSLSGSDAETQANDAVTYAEQGLSAHNANILERAHDKKISQDKVFAPAEPADLPALIAYAEALLDWSMAHGTATLLLHRDWIIAAAQRAAELDRSVDFGGPDRVLGIVKSTLTPDLGGNYAAAQESFETAMATAPGYLPNHLEYALHWATRMRDGNLYRRLLHETADGDAEAIPLAAPENRAAKKRAKELIAEARSW
jgi:hypothetical protein